MEQKCKKHAWLKIINKCQINDHGISVMFSFFKKNIGIKSVLTFVR